MHFVHENQLRIGALIPKRWAKRAVTRNAIRRQIYAWFEGVNHPQSAHRPATGWFVVRLRASFGGDVPPCAKSLALTRAVRAELDAMSAKLAGPKIAKIAKAQTLPGAPAVEFLSKQPHVNFTL